MTSGTDSFPVFSYKRSQNGRGRLLRHLREDDEKEREKEYFLLPITPRAPLDRALLVNIYRRLRDIWGRVRSAVVDAELLALPGSGDSLIARKELCEAKIGEQMSLSHNSFSTFSGL